MDTIGDTLRGDRCNFQKYLHCVSKNDSDVAHYNFNALQPILVIFSRDIAGRICY